LTKEQLFRLFIAFHDGTISEADLHTLKTFVSQESAEPWLDELMDQLADEESKASLSTLRSNQLFNRILFAVRADEELAKPKASRRLWYAVASAAAVLLFTFLFFQTYKTEQPIVELAYQSDKVMPGKAKGNLLLDNGEQIDLEKLNVNSRIVQDGYIIVKDKNGGISYELTGENPSHTLYNTIVTPKGGEYQLCLPDGTKIWVNASSKLRYPLNFGKVKREVELEGEALFEVAKLKIEQRSIPFIVKTGKQSLEVLGTTFNINSYDPMIRTTLVEGSVRLTFDGKKVQELKPNEQASYNPEKGQVSVKAIDPFYTIAWRNGSFAFDNANLYDVMAAIARWYAIDVDYNGNFEGVRFSGTIARNADIQKLLDLIALTGGVHFELKERRVTVIK